jgi:hypothetical protein
VLDTTLILVKVRNVSANPSRNASRVAHPYTVWDLGLAVFSVLKAASSEGEQKEAFELIPETFNLAVIKGDRRKDAAGEFGALSARISLPNLDHGVALGQGLGFGVGQRGRGLGHRGEGRGPASKSKPAR